MTHADVFSAQWHELAQNLCLPQGVSETILAELLAGYGDAARHYHNATHIVSMLRSSAEQDMKDHDTAKLAIFFHDLVYDPLRSDNEKCSADLMTDRLIGHIDHNRLEHAAAMILATARHQATGDHDTDLVLDLDMAILGQPWPVYERYMRGVMAEYVPHIGEAAWRKGRVAMFIAPTLAHGNIFLTEAFRPLEAAAMDNLRREQAWLMSGAEQ